MPYTDEDYQAGEGGCICALAVLMLGGMLLGSIAGIAILVLRW